MSVVTSRPSSVNMIGRAARKVAQALLQTADEIDRWANT